MRLETLRATSVAPCRRAWACRYRETLDTSHWITLGSPLCTTLPHFPPLSITEWASLLSTHPKFPAQSTYFDVPQLSPDEFHTLRTRAEGVQRTSDCRQFCRWWHQSGGIAVLTTRPWAAVGEIRLARAHGGRMWGNGAADPPHTQKKRRRTRGCCAAIGNSAPHYLALRLLLFEPPSETVFHPGGETAGLPRAPSPVGAWPLRPTARRITRMPTRRCRNVLG